MNITNFSIGSVPPRQSLLNLVARHPQQRHPKIAPLGRKWVEKLGWPNSATDCHRLAQCLKTNRELDCVLAALFERGVRKIFVLRAKTETMACILIRKADWTQRRLWGIIDLGTADVLLGFSPEFVRHISDHELTIFLEHELWHPCFELSFTALFSDLNRLIDVCQDALGDSGLFSRVVGPLGDMLMKIFAWQRGRKDFVRAEIATLLLPSRQGNIKHLLAEATPGEIFGLYFAAMLHSVVVLRRCGEQALSEEHLGKIVRILSRSPLPQATFEQMINLGNDYIERLVNICLDQDGGIIDGGVFKDLFEFTRDFKRELRH